MSDARTVLELRALLDAYEDLMIRRFGYDIGRDADVPIEYVRAVLDGDYTRAAILRGTRG